MNSIFFYSSLSKPDQPGFCRDVSRVYRVSTIFFMFPALSFMLKLCGGYVGLFGFFRISTRGNWISSSSSLVSDWLSSKQASTLENQIYQKWNVFKASLFCEISRFQSKTRAKGILRTGYLVPRPGFGKNLSEKVFPSFLLEKNHLAPIHIFRQYRVSHKNASTLKGRHFFRFDYFFKRFEGGKSLNIRLS